MLKNKKLFYHSMLLATSLIITTTMYAPWYDTPRIAMLKLYQQVQSLWGQSPEQQRSLQAQFSEFVTRIKPEINTPLLGLKLAEIEDKAGGTQEQWLKIKDLIANGADVNTVAQETGNSALHLALSDPNQELIQKLGILEFLTEYKANDRLPNKMEQTPKDILELLERINKPTQQVATPIPFTPRIKPLEHVSTRNLEELNNNLQLVLNALVKENDKAIWPSYWKSILNLINRGANINLQNENGDTALHLAVGEGNLGKVFTLLGYTKGENRINTEITNHNNETPYDIAQKLNNQVIIRMLPTKKLPYATF